MARGYLNRPELTAARFIKDPFAPDGATFDDVGGDPGADRRRPDSGRLYKSGDLCYRRPDGSMVFVGRVDHQVKLRGLRIELGEIETTLAAHPQIDKAVVIVTTSPSGDKDLTAYLGPTAGQTPDLAAIRAHLASKLPAYMIPAHFITLAEFPLNVNGKVDRRALPAPATPATTIAAGLTDASEAPSQRLQPGQWRQPAATSDLPATPTEAVLTRLFGRVLSCPPVSPVANFFDSGGNSLQVMRLIDLIARRNPGRPDPGRRLPAPDPTRAGRPPRRPRPGPAQRQPAPRHAADHHDPAVYTRPERLPPVTRRSS